MNNETERAKDFREAHEKEPGYWRGRIAGGLIIIGIGALLLARELGVVLPTWLFTWKMLLVAFAVYFTVKHLFKGILWIAILLAGVAFISDDMFGVHIRPYAWPALLIFVGIYFIFKPRRKLQPKHWGRWEKEWGRDNYSPVNSSEDFIDVVSFFSSTKSNVISKDFKGGDVVSFFGGAYVNLSQADFKEKVRLDITTIFGGVKVIVPAHWEVQSEIVSVLGGIEDKRPVSEEFTSDQKKIVVLSGTAAFGGITIES